MRYILLLFVYCLSINFCFADMSNSNSEIVKFIKNEKGIPALHYAIEQNRADLVEIFIELFPETINQPSVGVKLWHDLSWGDDYVYEGREEGPFPLELAIQINNSEIISLLLNNGANANVMRGQHSYRMFRNSDDDAILLFWGKIKERISPFFTAIKSGNLSTVKLILEKNPNLEDIYYDFSADRYPSINDDLAFTLGWNAIKSAIYFADEPLLREIIYARILKNGLAVATSPENIPSEVLNAFQLYKNEKHWPPLHYAMEVNDSKAFELLLLYGEDPYQTNPFSLFEKAFKHSNAEFINLLWNNERE